MTKTAILSPDSDDRFRLLTALATGLAHDLHRMQGVIREARDAFQSIADLASEDFNDA